MSETQKVEYDPSKPYRWDAEESFPLNGREFGFFFNTLITKKMELLKELEMINILEAKLRQAVEEGKATEKEEVAG